MVQNINRKNGFTLVELLVVLAIVAVLTSLATVAYDNSLARARDHQRLTDINRIQIALEQYHRDEGVYPPALNWGQALVGSTSPSTTYMVIVPNAPTVIDGDCPGNSNQYIYTPGSGNDSYGIDFCLGNNVDQTKSGSNCAKSDGSIAAGVCP